MQWPPITKPTRVRPVSPNLSDYAQDCAQFSWEVARQDLDGLPDGNGLNIAHEAVDRHALGERRGHLASVGEPLNPESTGRVR